MAIQKRLLLEEKLSAMPTDEVLAQAMLTAAFIWVRFRYLLPNKKERLAPLFFTWCR